MCTFARATKIFVTNVWEPARSNTQLCTHSRRQHAAVRPGCQAAAVHDHPVRQHTAVRIRCRVASVHDPPGRWLSTMHHICYKVSGRRSLVQYWALRVWIQQRAPRPFEPFFSFLCDKFHQHPLLLRGCPLVNGCIWLPWMGILLAPGWVMDRDPSVPSLLANE